MTSPLTLESLLGRLDRLPEEQIQLEAVAELLSTVEPHRSELDPLLRFRDRKYTRNLVHRSELFDVIVLCWRPGQRTPIHDHSGQRGWVRVLRGAIAERSFRIRSRAGTGLLSDQHLESGVPRFDEDRGETVDLEECGCGVVDAGREVVTVDRVRAIHEIWNPTDNREPAVSLHLYSRPHDCCSVFDLEAKVRSKIDLRFDNES